MRDRISPDGCGRVGVREVSHMNGTLWTIFGIIGIIVVIGWIIARV
jgi:hypothetical protein